MEGLILNPAQVESIKLLPRGWFHGIAVVTMTSGRKYVFRLDRSLPTYKRDLGELDDATFRRWRKVVG